MPAAWTPRDVEEVFARWRREHPDAEALLDAEDEYVAYHVRRFATLLNVAERALSGRPAPRALVIGPNVEVALLRTRHPAARVDTLGFPHPAFAPGPDEQHHRLDLNDLLDPARRPPLGPYDLVLLAEVVEHLHVPASVVLASARGWLAPDGLLVLQTPNACALHKRLRMLAGRNPYEPVRESPENPGHFHEYTRDELVEQFERAGLALRGFLAGNYFRPPTPAARIYAGVGPLLPERLRHGFTAWGAPAARR